LPLYSRFTFLPKPISSPESFHFLFLTTLPPSPPYFSTKKTGMVIGFNCTSISSDTFCLTYPLNFGNIPTTPSPTVIYSTTCQMISSPTHTSFASAFPVLLFILARRSSQSLKKLLRRKKAVVLEPSPWNIVSSSNNQSTRDLENTSCSLFPL